MIPDMYSLGGGRQFQTCTAYKEGDDSRLVQLRRREMISVLYCLNLLAMLMVLLYQIPFNLPSLSLQWQY